MASLPDDYLNRAYAGVLGKLIGVYVGRPFEGWTHQRILRQLGPIRYYVHEKVKSPLVVTDDDVSGTFVFVRALEEHGVTADLLAENIGRTWLNNTVERKSIFWWGGRGVSTEHTAFLNLKHGIRAPASGSKRQNGSTVAEQIGSQIFIDGWALVAPGNPSLAAKLARAAASVSHDGVALHAAMLWAAMEAEAFVSKDVHHLIITGLRFIPQDSPLRKLIADIQSWTEEDGDWRKTRQRIEDVYGYDKFPGHCHVMPNHGLMIMALLYGGHDFHEAIHIINTSGWDTDCNSGNIGCVVAIMHGLSCFDDGPDWRGPLADRALISSADGGYSINNAARITYDLVNMGHRLAGQEPLMPPKNGAQYHFTLPGSVQGFMSLSSSSEVNVQQAVDEKGLPGLAIYVNRLASHGEPVEVMTPTFSPPEVQQMEKIYDLMAVPLVSPGQTVTAIVRSDKGNTAEVTVELRLKHYTVADTLAPAKDGPSVTLAPGQQQTLLWVIPDDLDSQPIQQLGVALSCPGTKNRDTFTGTVWLESVSYGGTGPRVTLKRPDALMKLPRESSEAGTLWSFWSRAWIHNLSNLTLGFPAWSFSLAQDEGEGIMTTGTRDWIDYRVCASRFKVALGRAGLVIRCQGLHRYYALMLDDRPGHDGKTVSLVKARDELRLVLARAEFVWELDEIYSICLVSKGQTITGFVAGEKVLEAKDAEYCGGGMGAVVCDGSVSIDEFVVEPC